MIGGVIRLCGAFGGNSKDGDADYYDGRESIANTQIHEGIVAPFFRGVRADASGHKNYPVGVGALAKRVAPKWRRRIEKILHNQGYNDGACFYASIHSCLVWQMWHEAFPTAQWIIVRRNDEDIVRACMKSGFMSANTTAEQWKEMLDTYKTRFSEMITSGLDVWQIWPQRMIRGELRELQEMITARGLNWDEVTVEDYIAPIMWKSGHYEVKQNV